MAFSFKSCKIGYFEQTLSILKQKTILENVLEETNYTESFVRTILARLLFRREDVHKPVHILSGGERMKVALAKVFLGNYNMLLARRTDKLFRLGNARRIRKHVTGVSWYNTFH